LQPFFLPCLPSYCNNNKNTVSGEPALLACPPASFVECMARMTCVLPLLGTSVGVAGGGEKMSDLNLKLKEGTLLSK
jgi:hypothetical protein